MTEFTDDKGRRYVLTNELRFQKRKAFRPFPGGKEGDCIMIDVMILQQRRVYAGLPIDAAGEWHDVPTAEE